MPTPAISTTTSAATSEWIFGGRGNKIGNIFKTIWHRITNYHLKCWYWCLLLVAVYDMQIRAKSRSPEVIRSQNLKCAQNLTYAHILHSWMEDKVIVIPFPRDICSRDIISYFCSTHDQGFFKMLTHLAVYPGPFIKMHKKSPYGLM